MGILHKSDMILSYISQMRSCDKVMLSESTTVSKCHQCDSISAQSTQQLQKDNGLKLEV